LSDACVTFDELFHWSGTERIITWR